MREERAQRRLRWYAAAGLGLVAAGIGWDAAWHRRHDGRAIGGATELVQAHWLMLLGIGVIAGSALVAVVRAGRRSTLATRTMLVGSVLAVAGFGWDSIRHAQGTESAAGHGLIYAGLAAVTIGLVLAIVAAGRGGGSSA